MIFRWFKNLMRKQAQRDIEKFRKAFGPERCPVCSYHRYGYQHGFEDSPEPPAHMDCPEADCVQETD